MRFFTLSRVYIMMLILRDDGLIETFDSPEYPPNWIERIDVENEEYTFSSDTGQRYKGELIRKAGFFAPEKWRLAPHGEPDIENALALVDRAEGVDPEFSNLQALREHIIKTCNCTQ